MDLLASDFSDVLLPDLPSLPGMTSEAECRYLYWLASSQFQDIGAAVEIGSWLGRSSLHFAAGLVASNRTEKLHCFDRFTWNRSDSGKSNLNLRAGQNFQKQFEHNVARYGDRITAYRTQIADIEWPDAPIEVLFLDAPKKLPEITRCFEVFGASLIPGKSIIAIQDYLYFPAYALAACMYALRDYLNLIHVVLDGSTVAFQVIKPLKLNLEKPSDWKVDQWSPEQIERNWEKILSPLPEKARDRLEPAKALHLYDCGATQQAIDVMTNLPMTPFQKGKIGSLAHSHTYYGYPELFTAAGFPGTPKQNMMARAKRIRDWARSLRSAG